MPGSARSWASGRTTSRSPSTPSRSDGAKAVGIVTLVRAIPAAISAPFTSTLADRLPRVPFMAPRTSAAARRSASAGASRSPADRRGSSTRSPGRPSILGTAFLPAESALLPELARTPEELTAANVVRSTIDSVGTFAGPAIGGALLAFWSPGTVMLVTAAAFVWAPGLVAMIRPAHAPRGASGEAKAPAAFLREATGGFRAIGRDRRLRVVVGLYSAQTLARRSARRPRRRHRPRAAAPQRLHGRPAQRRDGRRRRRSASLAAFALIGRKRLASDFGLGIVLWGAPLAAIGIWPHLWVALVALAVLGLGNTLVDVAGLTLLQRTAPPDVIGRVFGVLEMILVGTIGLGAALAPVLIDAGRKPLVARRHRRFLPALAALTWRQLVAIDAESQVPAELELLEAVPIFSPLPAPTLERLASQLEPGHGAGRHGGHPPGRSRRPLLRHRVRKPTRVGRRITERRAAGRATRSARSRCFGTCRGRRPSRPRRTAQLQALEREDFLEAVTGHPPSARAADAVVGARLGLATSD